MHGNQQLKDATQNCFATISDNCKKKKKKRLRQMNQLVKRFKDLLYFRKQRVGISGQICLGCVKKRSLCTHQLTDVCFSAGVFLWLHDRHL